MPHFFIKSENVHGKTVTINDVENYRHIARSLRAKTGEKLLLIDENQIQYETVIKNISPKEITTEIKNSYLSKRHLSFDLCLAQSPLRSDSQSLIMEKATELGAAAVYPIYTDNCAVSKSVIEKKVDKWQRIMYEASKQCERADIPKCYGVTDIKTLYESKEFDYVIAFCERLSEKTFREYYNENKNIFDEKSKVLVIIGPEGGFSDSEFEYFRENSIPMLTLGDLILKADTAVITAIGNIIYEYNYSRKN
ncbi:16S rRNA (uracil(1498)-N(3))-methyltransferase [bacterium]|nr:16S rRNA (uracil(1498)-N(3))-methyltransferase [bacterium]